MRKAFIVLAHQLPEQLNIFIAQLLNMNDTEVFVHINRLNEDMKKEVLVNPRVHVSDDNIPIVWGSDSILKALIVMMREVESSSEPFDYVFLCSGQDLIVKRGLDNFLQKHYGEVFIDGYEQDRRERAFLLHEWPSRYKRLMDSKLNPRKILRRLRIELFKTGLPIAMKKIAYDTDSIVFYRNWFWCAMPADVLHYMLAFLDNNPGFWSIYDGALVPEEGFFSTIVMNSEFSDRIKYQNGKSSSLTYDGPRSNGHSIVITKESIHDIEESGKFFARKFDYRTDVEAIEYFVGKVSK